MPRGADAVLRRLVLVVGVAVPLFAAGCSGSGTPTGESAPAGTRRIILLTNGNSPYWDAAVAGAKNAERELKVAEAGLQVVIDRNNFNVELQLDKLKQYANATDVAAIGISVTDANNRNLAREMKRLRDAGIHVVAIDSDVDRQTSRDARFAYLGTENLVAGQELGKAAAGLLPEGGQFATFVGLKGAANAIDRIGGFADSAGRTFEQVESLGDGGDSSVAKKNVKDSLDRHPGLDLLVGIWSYNTPAIVDIVRESGIREQVKVVGFDADPPTIKGMEEGYVDAIVVQNPYEMGYQGVRLLKALATDDRATIGEMFPNHGQENGDLYDTGLKVVVPNAESPLAKDLFNETTQFLTLEEFKAWLAKYGLSGS